MFYVDAMKAKAGRSSIMGTVKTSRENWFLCLQKDT